MAAFIERVDRLIGLLGMSQNEFCNHIGKKSRATYSNWRNGVLPTTETEELICRRWMISVDSLRGYEGTSDLEPSPSLREAQAAMLYDFSRQDTPGSPEERLLLIYKRVHEAGMSEEAWCQWLKTSVEGWRSVAEGRIKAPELFIERAAFLAGWFTNQQAWMTWILTGQAETLAPASEREIRRMAEDLARSGLTHVDLIRKLKAQ